jgi:alkaline phosphatase
VRRSAGVTGSSSPDSSSAGTSLRSGTASVAGAGRCGHTGQAAKKALAFVAEQRPGSSAGAVGGASSLQITDHCMPRLIWKSMLRFAPRASDASGA